MLKEADNKLKTKVWTEFSVHFSNCKEQLRVPNL